jgi:hypothetical protein
MEDIMDVIFTVHKGKHLDTVQKYHVYQVEKPYRVMIEVPLLNKPEVIVKHDPLYTT